MRIEIKHQIHYSYSEPVFLEPQILRLRPRSDGFQELVGFELNIRPGDLLVAKAETQGRDAQVEHLAAPTALFVLGAEGGASGEDDPLVSSEAIHGIVGIADLGVHTQGAHLRRDEMDVLSAKIEYRDGVALFGWFHPRMIEKPTGPCKRAPARSPLFKWLRDGHDGPLRPRPGKEGP